MSAAVTRFLLIRHGETDWNRQQRFQGQIDVPLNATGISQAQRLAGRLGAEPTDVLVASDLQRARQTADALAAVWGLEVVADPGLREQAFGVLEGMDFPTIQREQLALWEQWTLHRADYALPGGGESQRAFYVRVLAATLALAQRYAGLHVAVVTHGGVLDMLWRNAKQAPLDGPRAIDIPNTGINRMRWEGERLVIESWADDAHLRDAAGAA